MEYIIHGTAMVHLGEECGIYKRNGIEMDYARMDIDYLVNTINGLPKPQAISSVTALRNTATKQTTWENVPGPLGTPFLVRTGPGPIPIDEVRSQVQNTVTFTDNVLRALSGK
ncbi:hypothetical protein HQ489_00070 [Candidatus Woesearchaeota archaeon]|nr:hypothetical protein [Candidatus Woesearchaeota archaeon]